MPVSTSVQPSSPGQEIRVHVPGPGRQRERDLPDAAGKLLHAATLSRFGRYEHMFYTSTGASGVPDRALQVRAQPGPRHAVQVVAEPLHGLRPPLHVLLRAELRASRRPAVRRPLRALDPREDERRRGPRPRARADVVDSATRWRSGRRRTRTSRQRAASGSRARASRSSARHGRRSRSSRAGRSSSATSTCSWRLHGASR